MLEFLREFNDLKQQGNFEAARQMVDQRFASELPQSVLFHSFLDIAQQQFDRAASNLDQLSQSSGLEPITEFGIDVAQMHLFWNTKQINAMIGPQQHSSELLPKLTEEECTQYSYWVAMYYNLTSKLVNREGHTDLAEEYLNKGIEYYELAGDPYAIIQSMVNLSVIEKDRGNYDRLIEILKDALDKLEHLDGSYLRAKQLRYMILGNIASTYLKKKQFEIALQTYKDSEVLVKEIGTDADYCVLLINLGSTSLALEQYEQATAHLEEALALSQKINNKFLEAYCQRNIAELEYNLRNFPIALQKLELSLEQSRELDLKIVIASNLSNIGLIKAFQGDLHGSLDCYLEVIDLIDREGGIFDPDFLDASYHAIATVYARQNRLDEAGTYWLKQLEICEEIGETGKIISVLFSLFQLTIDTGEPEQARAYYQRIEELSRSSTNQGILLLYQLVSALKLKDLDNSLPEAVSLLEDLVGKLDGSPMRVFGLNHQVTAIYRLCELYILELRQHRSADPLLKAQQLANQLTLIAQNQQLMVLEGETYILRSKLEVLEYNMSEAKTMLTRALELARSNQLTALEAEIQTEMASILQGKGFSQSDELDELMEQTQILMFLRTKGGSRGSLPDF